LSGFSWIPSAFRPSALPELCGFSGRSPSPQPPFNLPLAQVAADLGYTDQSHMTREFKQFAGVSPKRLLHEDVDFLQDFPSP
jgi:AraC-like DNA-binding protein